MYVYVPVKPWYYLAKRHAKGGSQTVVIIGLCSYKLTRHELQFFSATGLGALHYRDYSPCFVIEHQGRNPIRLPSHNDDFLTTSISSSCPIFQSL